MKKLFISLMATISLAFGGGNLAPTDATIATFIDAPTFKAYAGIAGANCPCSDVNSIDDVLDNTTFMGEVGAEYIGNDLLNLGVSLVGVPENNGFWSTMAYARTKDFHGLSALVGYAINDNCTDGDVEYGVQYERSGFYGKYLIEQEIASIGYSVKF